MYTRVLQAANSPGGMEANLVTILDHKSLWPNSDRTVNDVECHIARR
jgi:hypothetical protein